MVASSACSSRPETCRLLPNGATMSMPGLPFELRLQPFSFGPLTV